MCNTHLHGIGKIIISKCILILKVRVEWSSVESKREDIKDVVTIYKKKQETN